MPTAPRLTGPQIGTAPIPAGRVPTSAPLEAFGGGQASASVFGQAQGLLQDAGRIFAEKAAKEKKQALDIAHQANSNELLKLTAEVEEKVKSMKLADAFGAPDVADKEWSKGVEGIRKRIQDPDLQFAFDREAADNYAKLSLRTKAHTLQQGEEYDTQEFWSKMALLDEDSAKSGDPAQVALNQALKAAAYAAFADRKGIEGSSFEEGFRNIMSAGYAKAIRAQLDADRDLDASRLFDAWKGELTDKDRHALESAVRQGSRQGEAFRIVENALQGDLRTERDYMRKVNEALEGKDDGTKMMALALAERRWNQEAGMRAEEKAVLFQDTWNAVRKTGRIPSADIMDRLTVNQQQEILSALRPIEESHLGALTEILGMKREALLAKYQTPAQFFEKVRGKLSEKEYAKALEYYKSAVNAPMSKKDEGNYATLRSDEEVVRANFAGTGVAGVTPAMTYEEIKALPEAMKALEAFRAEVDDRWQAEKVEKNDVAKKREVATRLALEWAKKVTFKRYDLGIDALDGDEVKLVGDLKPEDLEGEMFDIKWEDRQDFHNFALKTGAIHRLKSLQDWEDEHRSVVNRAHIMRLRGRTDDEIEQYIRSAVK